MNTIWKFPVEITPEFEIEAPIVRFLAVQVQGAIVQAPYIWAEVDPNSKIVRKFKFYVRGTGHPMEDAANKPYFGTFQLHGGALVFHVFGGLA